MQQVGPVELELGMPLSQRAQYSDSKGMGLVKLGGVLCLAAVLFGSVCMTIVATMGDGEDPPKIFEQMVLVACGVFVLGMIVSLIGLVVYINQPEPPKPTLASHLGSLGLEEDENEDPDDSDAQATPSQENIKKPDPYASEHRRREF